MKKILSLFALTAIFAIAALADIRLPEPPKPKPTGKQIQMYVDVTGDVSEPTLVIKKSSAKLLRAALDEAEGMENNLAAVEAPKAAIGTSQTIVGGMFLTLAFIFGGVWMARSKPSKTIVGLFLLVFLGGASALVYANVAPPRIFGINKAMLSEEFYNGRGGFARGKVRVKIVSDASSVSDDIKLLIPFEEQKAAE